jgi:hypothetical protein
MFATISRLLLLIIELSFNREVEEEEKERKRRKEYLIVIYNFLIFVLRDNSNTSNRLFLSIRDTRQYRLIRRDKVLTATLRRYIIDLKIV